MADEAGFHGLGRRILNTLMAHPQEFGAPVPLQQLPPPPTVPGLPDFVLESEADLLFGEPPARSISLALPVTECDVAGSLAWTFGMPLARAAETNRQCDFLQILLVESAELISRPFLSGISSLRSLAGQLPGYMAHSVGDETTARVHRDLLTAGLTQQNLAHAHFKQARSRGFGGSIFVAVGIPSDRALGLMAPFRDELQKLTAELSATMAEAARNNPEGCEGRTCADCDDRDVCDKVRAVLAAHSDNDERRGAR